MVNVCMLFSSYLDSPNGASRFVREFKLNKELFHDEGINMEVISLDDFHPSSFSSIAERRRGGGKLKSFIRDLISRYVVLSILVDIFVNQKRMNTFVDEFNSEHTKYDIIHCTEPDLCYSLLKKRKSKGEKVYLTMHNDGDALASEFISRPALNTKLGRWYLNKKLNFVFKNVHRIGLTTQQSIEVFLGLHPEIGEDRVFYVYNGIRPNLFFKGRKIDKKKPLRFVCVGTIWERKNQKAIVEALIDMTEEQRSKLSVTFVGDGLMKNPLEELCKKHSINNTSFIGSVPDIGNNLENSDVFILVSYREGLPLSIIQAMSIGLPVVGSNIPGINEMVEDGETGFLCGVDTKSVKDSMIQMVQLTDVKYEKMSRASYQMFNSKFTIDSMIKRYCEEYKHQM